MNVPAQIENTATTGEIPIPSTSGAATGATVANVYHTTSLYQLESNRQKKKADNANSAGLFWNEAVQWHQVCQHATESTRNANDQNQCAGLLDSSIEAFAPIVLHYAITRPLWQTVSMPL